MRSGHGFMRGTAGKNLCVGFRNDDYEGPVANIAYDKERLIICTDTYEGYAMGLC